MQKVSRPATSFRPRGMMAALLAFAEAMRVQSGALQRRTRKMPGWEPGRSGDKGRHPGAFGGRLVRYAFPAGYTGCLLTPQEGRRRALREACAAAGMAVRGINT